MLRKCVTSLHLPFKTHAYIQHLSTSCLSWIHFIFLRCQETVISVFKGSVLITARSMSTNRCLEVPHTNLYAHFIQSLTSPRQQKGLYFTLTPWPLKSIASQSFIYCFGFHVTKS